MSAEDNNRKQTLFGENNLIDSDMLRRDAPVKMLSIFSAVDITSLEQNYLFSNHSGSQRQQ